MCHDILLNITSQEAGDAGMMEDWGTDGGNDGGRLSSIFPGVKFIHEVYCLSLHVFYPMPETLVQRIPSREFSPATFSILSCRNLTPVGFPLCADCSQIITIFSF
jgi:hypothetical protein